MIFQLATAEQAANPALIMPNSVKLLVAISCAFLIASCSFGDDGNSVALVYMDDSHAGAGTSRHRSVAERQVLAATSEGLVAFDAKGDIVPALAERWIVTDDAQSYIFRLRNSEWPDGQNLTSETVRDELLRSISSLNKTALGRDLAIISEVRAMAGRVVEIRLKSPMPQFMRLLAQPEMGLRRGGKGAGPMSVEALLADDLPANKKMGQSLAVLAPEKRGLPKLENWEDEVRLVQVEAIPASQAIADFYQGISDAVLDGRLASLPLADTSPLSRGSVRLDPVVGLFGLRLQNTNGMLSKPELREAIAMAIDRETLLSSFAVGGWLPETSIVPSVVGGENIRSPRWSGQSVESRQAEASRRVSQWRVEKGILAKATIYLPKGPGSDLMYERLSIDLRTTGMILERVGSAKSADIILVDQVAVYAGPRWFLNQVNCAAILGPCSQEADALVGQAIIAQDASLQADILDQAAQRVDSENFYIPLGAPVRWSLIRGGMTGFEANGWGVHPLFPMARRPN